MDKTKLINFQFYATPLELLDFAQGLIAKYAVHGYFIIGQEQDIKIEAFSPETKYGQSIVFSETELKVAKKIDELEKKNPNLLFLKLGEYSGSELRESWLFTLKTLESPTAMAIWQKGLKDLRKELMTGAWIYNTKAHTKKFEKSLRYSKGILDFFLNGGKVMPAYGKYIYLEF